MAILRNVNVDLLQYNNNNNYVEKNSINIMYAINSAFKHLTEYASTEIYFVCKSDNKRYSLNIVNWVNANDYNKKQLLIDLLEEMEG